MIFHKKKKLKYFGLVLLVVALGSGIFGLVISYQMSLIPSMTFEEMMSYTTEDNEKAVISVGIIQNGEMSSFVYGNNRTLLTNEDPLYEIGSITKTFTTALLCKAVEDGKIELSDPINQFMDSPGNKFSPSIERLVTHTSGYKNYYFDKQMVFNVFSGQKNDYYGIGSEDLIEKIIKVDLEDQVYGFEYSNFGIAVVGKVLEEIYDTEYTLMMNEFIKSELKLDHTFISKGSGDSKEYWNWNENDAYIPAGAIVSSLGDMLTYLNLHMNEDLPYLSIGHEALLYVGATSKSHEKMGIRIDSVGIGWMIDEVNNLVWHNGGTDEFNSYIAFDKENRIGVVILSNLPPGYKIPATVMGVELITSLRDN
ncbi:MAG: serine hydrolase domain-containing protein [Bacillota bacterium]|nr:serine hydrolase domain-containing protein [Bacillota bacterium]